MNVPTSFPALIKLFLGYITILIPLLAGIALLLFFSGIAQFIFKIAKGDEKAVGEGKNLMIWGIVALFVMVSVWGILRFLHQEVGFGGVLTFPTLPVYH